MGKRYSYITSITLNGMLFCFLHMFPTNISLPITKHHRNIVAGNLYEKIPEFYNSRIHSLYAQKAFLANTEAQYLYTQQATLNQSSSHHITSCCAYTYESNVNTITIQQALDVPITTAVNSIASYIGYIYITNFLKADAQIWIRDMPAQTHICFAQPGGIVYTNTPYYVTIKNGICLYLTDLCNDVELNNESVDSETRHAMVTFENMLPQKRKPDIVYHSNKIPRNT